MKKLLVFFLTFAMLFSLAACGGKDKGGDASDPNLGVYEGTVVTMFDEDSPMSEVYPGENSIELKSGDKCVFILDGDKINCDWKLEGTAITIDIEGVECKGTLKDGVIVIDFMGLMDMTFVKGGASASTSVPAASTSPASSLAGHYPVYSAVIGGQELDYATLVLAEVAEGYLTLNEDGTGEQCFEDDTPNIITDFDADSGVITFDTGETVNFTMDGDSISLEFPQQDMVMTFVKEDSALWDTPEAGSTAGSIMDAFGQGSSDSAALTIENPSSWYGWLYLEGDDELFADIWGIVDSDSDGNDFFEAYLDLDDEQPFMSMYVEIEDGLFINPVIGDEDAWVNDIYIDPDEDTSIYEGRLIRDNSLLFDFEHETGHITMCFRPEGAEWDPEVNDLIPPGYAGAAGSGSAQTPASSGAAPSGFGGEHTATIAEFMTDISADFTFTLPESGWVLEVYGDSTIYLYNVPTPDDAYSNSPRIQFELKESLEKIDFYKDQFENLKNIDSRTISGIEMKGRTYKNVGMEWIEYYGELPSGIWVTVKISDVSIDSGSEGSAILDSVSIK